MFVQPDWRHRARRGVGCTRPYKTRTVLSIGHRAPRLLRIMPRLPDFRARLAAVPEDATPADLAPLAAELAMRCSAERYPRKSVAAALRHAHSLAPEATVEALRKAVESVIEEQDGENDVPVAEVSEPFLGIAEAARRLNLSVKTLTERLREVRYRRLYGWPWWDGHQWNFSPAPLDPTGRATYMASLPLEEPAAHTVMLPPWCAREQSDASAA